MPLSPDEVKSLQERRQRALALPLVPDAVLAPTAPPLQLEALTPTANDFDAFSSPAISLALESPNPYRPFKHALRSVVSRRSGWRSRRFRLFDGLCLNKSSPAQVWRVEVSSDGEVLGMAVLKLVVEAIFSGLLVDSGEWTPACEAVKSELRAYAALRPVQGRDVPHCYGAFPFLHPSGEAVAGILLEDLSTTAVPASPYCKREREAGRLQSANEIDPLVAATFCTLHRLQRLNVARFKLGAFDVLILDSSSSSGSPHLVFLDFTPTISGDEAARIEAEDRAKSPLTKPWQALDEYKVNHLMKRLVPDVWAEWFSRELEEKRLPLFQHEWSRAA
ncbi:hypothetical protein JCM8097_001082 [Rhodosporidiobolus ruineniae]